MAAFSFRNINTMRFTEKELRGFLDNPANRKRLLEEHDVEIVVESEDTPDDPRYTIRRIVRPEANYLITLFKEDGDDYPANFALPGCLIAEFSTDGSLGSGVENYLMHKTNIVGIDNQEVLLEVYKLPEEPGYCGRGAMHEGMYVPDRSKI